MDGGKNLIADKNKNTG